MDDMQSTLWMTNPLLLADQRSSSNVQGPATRPNKKHQNKQEHSDDWHLKKKSTPWIIAFSAHEEWTVFACVIIFPAQLARNYWGAASLLLVALSVFGPCEHVQLKKSCRLAFTSSTTNFELFEHWGFDRTPWSGLHFVTDHVLQPLIVPWETSECWKYMNIWEYTCDFQHI